MGRVIIFAGVLTTVLGGIIMTTELYFPFTWIRSEFAKSPENLLSIEWSALILKYRTSLLALLMGFFGGGLLIFKARFGWVLSVAVSFSYFVIYSTEFIVDILNQRHQSSFFLTVMVCFLFFLFTILSMKGIRLTFSLTKADYLTVLFIVTVLLQQYYR